MMFLHGMECFETNNTWLWLNKCPYGRPFKMYTVSWAYILFECTVCMCAFIEDIICVWNEGYRERKESLDHTPWIHCLGGMKVFTHNQYCSITGYNAVWSKSMEEEVSVLTGVGRFMKGSHTGTTWLAGLCSSLHVFVQ